MYAVSADSIYPFLQRKMLEDWEEKWRGVLHQTFLTQLGALKKSFYGNGLDRRMSIYPYLVSLPPEEFINVMMQVTLMCFCHLTHLGLGISY